MKKDNEQKNIKSENEQIGGAALRKMLLSGSKLLEKNKAYVDSLNVFPVPDGDTGTNMALTLRSVVKELDACPSNELDAICDAIAKGALKGARGNSGVIISQILKGITSELKNLRKDTPITTKVFARALEQGSRIAYQAVTVPKEGTILTVIRVIAEESKNIARKESNFLPFLEQILKVGEEILAKTPEMLPVLKKAGVVDAGGRGLLYLLNGFIRVLSGHEDTDETAEIVEDGVTSIDNVEEHNIPFNDLGEIEFAYCTEFMISSMNKTTTLASIDGLRQKLMEMGDSVICVGDLSLVKVHIHTNTPGVAITEALKLGEIINLKVENMLEQNRELHASRKIPEKEQGIVAVAAGDGIIQIFRDLGVDFVIKGGQTMNPSADDIAKAAERVHAKTVFILPNNKNIILAARHAQSLIEKNLIIIPTMSINEGISACIAYNAEQTIEENTDAFLAGIQSVKSGAVTYAVRNTKLARFDIKEGEILGLDNKTILTKGKTPSEVTLKLVEKLISENIMNITLFFGEEVREKDAIALRDKLADKYPNCEVSAVSGGQPVYYYLISLE